MTSQRLAHIHTLQLLGVLVGIAVPLTACATMVCAATTGMMPMYATGIFPLLLLGITSILGCWIWTETVELR
ncbi:MAG: hypothetical protein H7Y37_14085 [Anaerolineae bacterium]|nr:hypothetical protein [Gloeobacterales cyanobacterium ES-bin-313]